MYIFAHEMLRPLKIINQNLSMRLSLIVVSAMAILLLASLVVMMTFARRELREEALQKAAQSLESTVQRIDNILLSVEQASGNFYFRLLPQLGDKERIAHYSRQLVESNPYIEGCAIALEPDFYNDGQPFMAYYHRTDSTAIVRSEQFADGPYTEQAWYIEPMKTGKPGWMKPLANMGTVPADAEGQLPATPADSLNVITFSLPIYDMTGKPVGIMGVDVSLSLMLRILHAAKPSANSYATLLDSVGTFIVHPNKNMATYQNALSTPEANADPSVRAAVQAMLNGETDYRPVRLNGSDCYVFYKPFKRTFVSGRIQDEMGWSLGIIYPTDDIFGDYNSLLNYVAAIAIIGLLLLLLLCRMFIHRQLLPLQLLTTSAQRIAEGHYNETIPDSHQQDEIGRLQTNFQMMQQSLAKHIGELEQLTETLVERGNGLKAAYEQAQKADRMKTAFLHNMTNQMLGPADIKIGRAHV